MGVPQKSSRFTRDNPIRVDEVGAPFFRKASYGCYIDIHPTVPSLLDRQNQIRTEGFVCITHFFCLVYNHIHIDRYIHMTSHDQISTVLKIGVDHDFPFCWMAIIMGGSGETLHSNIIEHHSPNMVLSCKRLHRCENTPLWK